MTQIRFLVMQYLSQEGAIFTARALSVLQVGEKWRFSAGHTKFRVTGRWRYLVLIFSLKLHVCRSVYLGPVWCLNLQTKSIALDTSSGPGRDGALDVVDRSLGNAISHVFHMLRCCILFSWTQGVLSES